MAVNSNTVLSKINELGRNTTHGGITPLGLALVLTELLNFADSIQRSASSDVSLIKNQITSILGKIGDTSDLGLASNICGDIKELEKLVRGLRDDVGVYEPTLGQNNLTNDIRSISETLEEFAQILVQHVDQLERVEKSLQQQVDDVRLDVGLYEPIFGNNNLSADMRTISENFDRMQGVIDDAATMSQVEKYVDKACEEIDFRIEELEKNPVGITTKQKKSGILHLAPMTLNSEPGEVYLSTKMVIRMPEHESSPFSLSKMFPEGIPDDLAIDILDDTPGVNLRYDADANCLLWNRPKNSRPKHRWPKVVLYSGDACWIKDETGRISYYREGSPFYRWCLENLKKLKSRPVSVTDFEELIKDKRGYSHKIQVQRRIRVKYKEGGVGSWKYKRKWSTVLSCNYHSKEHLRFSRYINIKGVFRARRKTKRQDWSDWKYFLYFSRSRSNNAGGNTRRVKEL